MDLSWQNWTFENGETERTYQPLGNHIHGWIYSSNVPYVCHTSYNVPCPLVSRAFLQLLLRIHHMVEYIPFSLLFLATTFEPYNTYNCSGQPETVQGRSTQVKSPPPPPAKALSVKPPPPPPSSCGVGLVDNECSTAGVQSSCCTGYICTKFLVSSGQNVLRCSKSASPPPAIVSPPPRLSPPPQPKAPPPPPPCYKGSSYGECKVEGAQDSCCPGYTCTLVKRTGGIIALQCKGTIDKLSIVIDICECCDFSRN